MTSITYHIVEHDGGWAYKLGNAFSETFASHDQAKAAAHRAAAEQEVESVQIVSERDDPLTEGGVPNLTGGENAGRRLDEAAKADPAMHANAATDAREEEKRRVDAKERDEKEEELEEGLEDTFPASDPVSASQITKTGAPGEFAKKKDK